MKNPFDDIDAQPMLPYDSENQAFRLRDHEYKSLCKNIRFLTWLRFVVSEASEANISHESYAKMLTAGTALSKTARGDGRWVEYVDFVSALVWLHSKPEEVRNINENLSSRLEG